MPRDLRARSIGLAKVQADKRLITADAPTRYASTIKASSPRSTRISSILPTYWPSASQAFVPRSRSMLIRIVDLLPSATWNVLDDVASDPYLPRHRDVIPG